MSSVESSLVGPSGASVAVLSVSGPGAPVLLLHGVTDGAESYRPVLERLAGRHRAVAASFRGHGGSEWRDSYELDDYVADTVALIEELFSGPVAVAGHSLGGMVAAALAARHPDLVMALLVEDTPYFSLRESARNEGAAWYPGFREIRDLLARGVPDDEDYWVRAVGELSALLPDSSIRIADVLPEDRIRLRAAVLRGCDPRVLDPILASELVDGFAPAELERIACPTTLVAGQWAYGGAMTADDVAAWKAHVPQTQVTVLDNAGHLIHHFEQSREVYLRELDALLEELVSAGPAPRA